MSDERLADVDAWGIQTRWTDARKEQHTVAARTVTALREVIGDPPGDVDARSPLVVRPGSGLPPGPVAVICEDGSRHHLEGRVPDDFPLGYHRMRASDGSDRSLIVSPGRCWLPDGRRGWGWAVQLYAVRSRSSWGIGDLADLRAVRRWAQGLGAGFLMVNPLHASAPTLPQEASPYLPATRRFLNLLYVCVEEVPGAEAIDLSDLAGRGRALNTVRWIDRDAVFRLKREGLRRIFDSCRESIELDAWRATHCPGLERFGLWCALAERHGPDWRDWPAVLRSTDPDTVERLLKEHRTGVDFHTWVQWVLDRQLRAACGDMTVIQDLPVGVDGGGADAWAAQDQLATGVTVGAPPDIFNPRGQDWGSPPFIPWRLRAGGYDAFVQSVRATMALTGGLRIDHVMGLFRLWWVPEGRTPADGAYVRCPSDDLLDIVALESHRANALVVGEDLGTVEPGVRDALLARRMLSYRLLWFESDDPTTWPATAMAAVTTHDLPTVAGLWNGADLADADEHHAADPAQLRAGRERLLRRLEPAALSADATEHEAVLGAYRLLARAPSMLLTATLEDAVLEERRPNLPGVAARTNWSMALPMPLEQLVEHPTALGVAQVLRAAVSG